MISYRLGGTLLYICCFYEIQKKRQPPRARAEEPNNHELSVIRELAEGTLAVARVVTIVEADE